MKLNGTQINFTIPFSSLFKFYPNEVFRLYDIVKAELVKMNLNDVETRINYIENQTTNYLKHFCDIKEYTDEEFDILYEKFKSGIIEDPFMFITDDAIIDDYRSCSNEIKKNMDSGRYISIADDELFTNKEGQIYEINKTHKYSVI